MKIVFCITHCEFPYGGIRILFEQANRLTERGHQVEVWTLSPNINESFSTSAKVLYVPSEWSKSHPQKLTGIFPERVGGISPDIFVVGGYPVAQAINKFPNAKSFWYMQHDESFACFSRVDFETLEEALKLPISLLTNSRWTKEVIKNKYRRESELLPYGLDSKIFHPVGSIFRDSIPTVVLVYSDADWKGPREVLQALNLVNAKKPEVRVVAISAFFPKLIQAYKGSVFFIQPKQEEMAAIYSSATVFASASWLEGFGLPGLEAMACGVPVVTTDSGGVRDYAIPEETAVVVPAKDPEALAEGILRVLEDTNLQNKLRQNGFLKVKEFDWDKHIDKLEKIFDTSLQK